MEGERALALLRELERADDGAAAVLAELDELARGVEDVRRRAAALEAFLGRLPAKREAVAAALAESGRAVRSRHADVERAEDELATAEAGRDADRLAEARRGDVRARDALRMAERKLETARAEKRRLEAEVNEADREREQVDERARLLASALAGQPGVAEQAGGEPATGPAGAAEWASRARAALFVARGRLVAEREALIRQANELGTTVLGEPLAATTASVVARRVERELES